MHATRWYCSSCSAPVRAWMLGNCAETVLNIILLFKVLKYGYLLSLKSSFFYMEDEWFPLSHTWISFLFERLNDAFQSQWCPLHTNKYIFTKTQTGWNHKSTSSALGKNMPILPLHDDNCGFVYFFVCKLGDFLWWLTGLGWSVNIYLEFFKKKLKN